MHLFCSNARLRTNKNMLDHYVSLYRLCNGTVSEIVHRLYTPHCRPLPPISRHYWNQRNPHYETQSLSARVCVGLRPNAYGRCSQSVFCAKARMRRRILCSVNHVQRRTSTGQFTARVRRCFPLASPMHAAGCYTSNPVITVGQIPDNVGTTAVSSQTALHVCMQMRRCAVPYRKTPENCLRLSIEVRPTASSSLIALTITLDLSLGFQSSASYGRYPYTRKNQNVEDPAVH